MPVKKTLVEVNWQPDRKDSRPAYIQIADYFLNKIQSGEWIAGSYLPDQRRLSKLLGVNRSTLISALDELRAMDLLETKGKGGTVIANTQILSHGVKAPNWKAHIDEGFHISNLDTIQIINRYEFTEGYIRLSSGEPSPELFPKEMMKEVLGSVADEMTNLGYEEPKGMLYLREQVSNYLKPFGIQAPPENILIVSGALQAIQLISIGLMQPGSTVFLEKPSYLYSLNIFQSIGLRRSAVPMDQEGLIPNQLIQTKPKHRQSILYTVPSFHNPTGIVMSERRRKELLEVCIKNQIPIIEDDVYRELWIDEPSPLPIKSLDQNNSVLYVGSVSKTLSTGLRIGWLVGPEAVIERLGDLKMQNDYGSSSLSQLTAGKFLESGLYQAHSAFVREKLKIRRQVTIEALELYFKDLADWSIPQGGYYIWLKFKWPLPMKEFFEEAFIQGILAYPGFLYDNEMNQCLRISYSYASIDQLVFGIEKLSKIARGLR